MPVLRGGGLFGKDIYDPSVYYAGAVGLFAGRLPYRDFLLLHPPGILLALQPFAALGAVLGDPTGMAMARLGFMVLGTVSTTLIYQLLLRHSLTAAMVGASLYAVWYPAVYSERSVFLEPLGTILLLVALTALVGAETSRRPRARTVLAGVALGLAVTVKIWGVVPVTAVGAWLWWRRGRADALRFGAGAAAAASVVCLPFVLLGPQMWQMVVLDQIARGRADLGLATRLPVILGLGPIHRFGTVLPLIVAIVLLGLAGHLALASREGQLSVVLAAACTATLLIESSWFSHYAAFAAAPLCLVFGTAAGVASDRLASIRGRRALTAACLAGLALVACGWASARIGSVMPGPRLGSILSSRPGCVTTDNPATLIASNTLRRNFASGCPLVVDLGGYVLDFSRRDATTSVRPRNRAFQSFAMQYLRSGTSTMVVRFGLGGFTPANLHVIDSWQVSGRAGGITVRAPHD